MNTTEQVDTKDKKINIPGIPLLDTDDSSPVIAIGTRDLEFYFWLIATQLTMNDEVRLTATDNRIHQLIRLVDMWAHFGVEEIRGTRRPVLTKGFRDGNILRVTQIKLRRKGILR